MSEDLGPIDEHRQVMESFIKIDRIVQRLGSLFPEDPYAWVGTVDERLAHLLGRLIHDPHRFADLAHQGPPQDPDAMAKVLKHYLEYTPPRGQTEEVVMLDDHAFTEPNRDDKPKVSEGVPLDISWAFTKSPKDENGEKVSVGVDTSPLGSDQPPF